MKGKDIKQADERKGRKHNGGNQSKLEKTCHEHTQREEKMYILVARRIALFREQEELLEHKWRRLIKRLED